MTLSPQSQPLPETSPTQRLALDLSGHDIACALADESGGLHNALRAPLAPYIDAPARWLALVELSRETLRRANVLPSQVAGCGIAFPGAVSANGLVERDARLPGWEGFDLPRAIREHLGIAHTRAESRLLCAALGESQTGALRPGEGFDGRDWVFAVWGASIQAVVCSNGQLLRGADGASGVLGAVCVERDGAISTGGRRGGLDAYNSLDAMGGRASSFGLSGRSPREIWDLADSSFAAQSLRDDTVARWAQALGAAVVLLNPRRIVLGGAVARELGQDLLGPLRTQLTNFCLPIHARNLQLGVAELGHDAALLGAALIARNAAPHAP